MERSKMDGIGFDACRAVLIPAQLAWMFEAFSSRLIKFRSIALWIISSLKLMVSRRGDGT